MSIVRHTSAPGASITLNADRTSHAWIQPVPAECVARWIATIGRSDVLTFAAEQGYAWKAGGAEVVSREAGRFFFAGDAAGLPCCAFP
jgi:hypothetical protein